MSIKEVEDAILTIRAVVQEVGRSVPQILAGGPYAVRHY